MEVKPCGILSRCDVTICAVIGAGNDMQGLLRAFYGAAWIVITYAAQPICCASSRLNRLKAGLNKVRVPSPFRPMKNWRTFG